MFHEQLLRDWGIDSYCGPSLWNSSIPWNIYYLAWYFVNMQGCKYLMGLIIGYHSGYYSSFYMLSCTRYRGSKIEQAFCLIEKSNRSSMIIAYNYFHSMINEYQGADDKAKGTTESLSLVSTLQTLINYSFDRLNFFLRQRTARNLFHGTILVLQQEVL